MELPSFDEAVAMLDAADPASLALLFQEVPDPAGPRNRHQRRALKKHRRARERGPVPPREDAKPAGQNTSAKSVTDLPLFFLQQWAATRGPLFENPCVAVARAIAMECAFRLARAGSGDFAAGLRAARYVGEHLKAAPDSKAPATGEAYARASALLVDVRRAAREGGDPIGAIHRVLAHVAATQLHAGAETQLALVGWAHLLAAVLCAEDDVLRLRAARTLLHWSAGEAFKVGRGNIKRCNPDELDLIARARESVGRAEPDGSDPDETADARPHEPPPQTVAPT